MISLRIIDENDFFDDSLGYINTNFKTTEEQLNLLNDIIDTANKTIQNIESLEIKKGDNTSISDILFTTNGSISAGGNIISKQNIEANNINIVTNLNVQNGTMTLRNVNALNDIKGGLRVNNEFVLGSAGADPIPMQFNSLTKLVGIIGFQTITVGKLIAKQRSYMELDFSGRNVSNTNDWLNNVRLDTADIPQGQRLEITVILPDVPIALDTYRIVNGRIANNSPLSITNIAENAAVEFTASYQTATFIFRGTSWRLNGLYGGATVQIVTN